MGFFFRGGFAVVLALSSLSVRAELRITVPSEACRLMRDAGLVTRGWKNDYGSEYWCSSPYKQIGVGYPLANNLAYYVDGTKKKANQVKLVLNVNNRSAAEAGHNELLRASSSLVASQTGQEMPESLRTAIEQGLSVSEVVGKANVDVVREDWPTGKGYEMKVIIK
ncbi:MAG: DUF6030 family protein [Thiohalomonadaceae bacterium]